MVSKEDKNLFKLEKCNFNEEHKCDAFKYCINCAKFLCDECLKIHYIPFKETHILLNQKVENQIYCKKKGHSENKINRYCIKCEKYFCPECKCEHEKDTDYYYYLSKTDNKIKIKKINAKIQNK